MPKKIKRIQAGRVGWMVAYTAPQAGDSPKVRRQKQKASSAAREMLNARYSYSKLERTLAANSGAPRLSNRNGGDFHLISTLTTQDMGQGRHPHTGGNGSLAEPGAGGPERHPRSARPAGEHEHAHL